MVVSSEKTTNCPYGCKDHDLFKKFVLNNINFDVPIVIFAGNEGFEDIKKVGDDVGM